MASRVFHHAIVDTMLDLRQLADEPLRRLRRTEYEQLAEAGAFDDEPRVELLDGVILAMSPVGGPHTRITARLGRWLIRALDDRWDVIVRSSFSASEYSMPEPDVAVTRAGPLTRPSTARLVIEVAETSLARDRYKARIYAEARVPEYWIVDLPASAVEVYTKPKDGRYTSITTHGFGETLRPTAFPSLSLLLDRQILPHAPRVRRRPRRR
jgi:Uma2 family endonuclease